MSNDEPHYEGENQGLYQRIPPAWEQEREKLHHVGGEMKTVVEFSRQEYGREMARIMDELTEQIRHNIVPAFRAMSEGLFQFQKDVWPLIESLSEAAEQIADDKPVHPGTVRDTRGIKKPSTVTPMWANNPNQRRRR